MPPTRSRTERPYAPLLYAVKEGPLAAIAALTVRNDLPRFCGAPLALIIGIERGHASEEDVAAANLDLGILDVFIKVRPEKPKPGRCIILWVERKWRTIGSESPACRFQAFLNTFVSSTVIRMFWRRCSAHVDTRYSKRNKPG